MNAAFLLMSSAWIAGGDPGCSGCVAPVPVAACDSCSAPSMGLVSKFKSKLHSCTPCGTPLFTKQPSCDPCGSSSPGLLSKLKARFHHSKDCATPCGTPDCATSSAYPSTGGCALPAAPGTVMPTPAPETPKVMPKPMDEPAPKKVGLQIPSVGLPAASPSVPY